MTEAVIRKAMTMDDYDLAEFITKAADAGELSKAEAGELLNRRVATQRLPTESFAQAYNRLLARGEDHAGSEVFRKYMRMRGPDEGQVAAAKALAEPAAAAPSGPGQRYLDALTTKGEEIRKVLPGLTKEQAFAKAYVDPANADLVAGYRRERAG